MTRSILFVHAHPDDECIPTGVTIAKYARDGARVTVVTCTLGEVGEIVADDLKHLDADALGEHRKNEMAEAARILGVTDHRWLGGAGRWRDSGMMGTPENDDPRAFWQADMDEATEALKAVIEEVRPQVVVSYDSNGDYGHPDHIQAHRVTVAAIAATDGIVSKRYEVATPKSMLAKGFEHFKATGDPFFAALESADDLPFGKPDEVITSVVQAPELLETKYAAMRAHRSQIAADGFFFALPEDLARTGFGHEHYVLAMGTPGGPTDENGWETDLFGGLGHAE